MCIKGQDNSCQFFHLPINKDDKKLHSLFNHKKKVQRNYKPIYFSGSESSFHFKIKNETE